MIQIISQKYAECFDMECSKSYEIVYVDNGTKYKLYFSYPEVMTDEEIMIKIQTD